MKKMALGVCLALATFGLFLSPALAESNLPQAAPVLSAADQTFLASLAVLDPTFAAKRPSVGRKALCTATANCGNGATVYCESNSSATSCSAADRNCSAGEQGHVTCDGNTYWCGAACSDYCTLAREECFINCYPCGINFTCDASNSTHTCHCRFRNCF